MLTLKQLLSSLLVLAITASPVMAGSNDAKTASENTATANTTSAEATPAAASPSLTSPAVDANVTALLGVLVMKGVLAPNEANAIRNADPKANFSFWWKRSSQGCTGRSGFVCGHESRSATLRPRSVSGCGSGSHLGIRREPGSRVLAGSCCCAPRLSERRPQHRRWSRRSRRCAYCRSIRPKRRSECRL